MYRGDPDSSFYGVYVFGDFESRRVWGIKHRDGKLVTIRELGRSPAAMSSFGVDHDGELYLVGYDGLVYHVGISGSRFASPRDWAVSLTNRLRIE